jgi:uncharacterized protein
MKTPLFPLNTLVCPGGKLPLRVFEARYLDMVKRCLRSEEGFVVVMLKGSSDETSVSSQIYRVGTLVKIIDFDQDEQGILCIVSEGISRVKISNPENQSDGLWLGDISKFKDDEFVSLPEEFSELQSVLKALVQHPVVKELNMDIDYDDGRQIGWRLTELLPLDNSQKQYLYELQDPIRRLEKISDQLDIMVS